MDEKQVSNELKWFTNGIDSVVAETPEEAMRLCAKQYGYSYEDAVEKFEGFFLEDPEKIIRWAEECGYSEYVETKIADLIVKYGKGFTGSTEC